MTAQAQRPMSAEERADQCRIELNIDGTFNAEATIDGIARQIRADRAELVAEIERLKEEGRISQAIEDAMKERRRQDDKWGEQNHAPLIWVAILSEEVGEFAQAALHAEFGGDKASGLRDEAVHCAAVALAIVESLDRRSP